MAEQHTQARPADTADLATGLDQRPLHLDRPLGEDDHLRGSLSAPVGIVEYGDYECPFCADALPGVEQLLARFGDRVVFAFRHFPLVSQHPHAWGAALAAEAAGRQGAFWPMHNHLLGRRHELSPEELRRHAGALGLDLERFDRDLEEPDVAARVRRDALSGLHSGVAGTPTFFVAGMRLEGGFRAEELAAAIEARI